MNPRLDFIRWLGVALLALAEVLSQTLDSLPISLAMSIPAFLCIIAASGLNRMWFFAPIRVIEANVRLDTLPIRRAIRAQSIKLIVQMKFALLYGAGGVDTEVEVQWPKEIEAKLSQVMGVKKRNRMVRLTVPECLDAEVASIPLRLGIPEEAIGELDIGLRADSSERTAEILDGISEELEGGAYAIVWKPLLGKPKKYVPKVKQ